MPAIAVSALSKKWQAYQGQTDGDYNDDIYIKVKFPYTKLDMRAIPQKMISTYNIITTNNWCRDCSTTESRVRLSMYHVLTTHGIDINKNLKATISLAEEAHNLLKEIKRESNSYDRNIRKICKQKKIDIINNINYIKEYWDKMYDIIVNMILG